MKSGHLIPLLVLGAWALVLAGCVGSATPSPSAQASTAPASPSAPIASSAPPPVATSASASPALTPWPTIDPTLAFGNVITCEGLTATFTPSALNAPPGAENGTDTAAAALRTILRNPNFSSLAMPATGWRRVVQTTTQALFMASGPEDGSWRYLLLETAGVGEAVSGWYSHGGGGCVLQLALPDDVGRAQLTLDPARLSAAADKSIKLLIVERSCAGGASPEGRVLVPQVAYRQDAVLVSLAIRKRPGAQD